jgi:hypothetical protein
MAISIVNMIPQSLSGETNQDSEPNIAVNSADPQIIAGSAFTPDPDPNAIHAPIFISTDGGNTWSLNSIVPHNSGITADITLRFSSTKHLYVAYLALGDLVGLTVSRTGDMTFSSEMEMISHLVDGDQPYVQAATVPAGPNAGKERVYVGYSDGWAQMHYSLDGAVPQPTFSTVKIDSRGFQDGIGYDLPQVRTAVHPDGVVYAVFYSVHIGSPSGTSIVDVVVVRDDQGGTGALPFTDLEDSADSKPGQRVVTNVILPDGGFGQERGDGELSIAVDPNDSSILYVAWADEQPSTGYTLHVRRSTDSGQSWPDDDLWTIPMAQNPALAVNSAGVVGFVYQQFIDAQLAPRWETHFRYTFIGGDMPLEDLLLATVPADTPDGGQYNTYLGDYIHLMAVGEDFYGVFSANNTPDPNNFPNKVTYQRNHDFLTKKLFALDGVTEVPISIDPFFFKVTEIQKHASFLAHIYEFAVDPLAILLPSSVYVKLIEKFDPHVPKVAQIRDAARSMTPEERAFVLAKAHMFIELAKEVEEALSEGP